MATKLTPEQMDTLTDAVGMSGGEVRSYSGRGMYGAQCLAITVDSMTNDAEFLMTLALDVADSDGDLARTLADGVRSDSLGRGTVYYWPGIEYDAEDEDEEV